MAKENRGRLHRRLAAALAVLALGMAAVPALPASLGAGSSGWSRPVAALERAFFSAIVLSCLSGPSDVSRIPPQRGGAPSLFST